MAFNPDCLSPVTGRSHPEFKYLPFPEKKLALVISFYGLWQEVPLFSPLPNPRGLKTAFKVDFIPVCVCNVAESLISGQRL